LRALLSPASRIRYLIWRMTGSRRDLTVSLRNGPCLVIRPAPAGDLSVAYEIFVDELYRSPRPLAPAAVRRIVDVGANVGYALNYFARAYPAATIVAFEPHPAHLAQIERNLAANALSDRVQLIRAAAAKQSGSAFLIDAGEASQVVDQAGDGRIPITLVDLFAVIGAAPIDLLKLDCEGAEFDLLIDKRFAQLEVRALVLEWHTNPQRPRADATIRERLATLGFSLVDGIEYTLGDNRFGLLWAYRP
jgi:FkbM family methyltransferase